jgi:hypothetical protein
MPRRTLNLAAVAGAVAVLVWIGSGLVVGERTKAVSSPAAPSSEVTSPSPLPSPSEQTAGSSYRGYALAFPDVSGLPTDLAQGARLELWVAWEPPITTRPRIQRLVEEVVYDRTVPAAVEGQPATALVLVHEDDVGDLMYGDRYGSLSAALVVE